MLRMTPAKFKEAQTQYRVALVGALFAKLRPVCGLRLTCSDAARGHPWYTPTLPGKRPAQRSYLGRSDHDLFVALQVVAGPRSLHPDLGAGPSSFVGRENKRAECSSTRVPEDWFKP